MESPHLEHTQKNSAISWQADDFYYHPKSFLWYLATLLVSLVVAGVPLLLSGGEDYMAPIVIIIALLAFMVYAGRKPQKKNFELTNTELRINSQPFDLLMFSKYWVETFDTHTQVTLVGAKRTAMPIGLCLTDKELTKKILSSLQNSLPESYPSQNPADWLTRKIKF